MNHSTSTLITRVLALLPAVAVFSIALHAQNPVPVNSSYTFYTDTVYDGSAGSIRQQVTANTTWLVADGVTVTVANNYVAGSGVWGGIFGQSITNDIRIEPLDTTGRVQFINNIIEAQSSIARLTTGRIFLTNVDFIGNQSLMSDSSSEGGGIFRADANSEITMTHVYFERNSALQGGIACTVGNMFVNSGTFIGNYAHSLTIAGAVQANQYAGYGGGFQLSHTAMRYAIVRDSFFAGNWARRGGGAISFRNRYSMELWDPAGISNNFAGYGGFIYDSMNAAEAGEGVLFKYTGTTAMTNFVYSGNMAKGSEMIATEIAAAIATGAASFTPHARGGGFYYSGTYLSSNVRTRLFFDIADNVTVQIGQAGNPASWDSIATMDQTGSTARIELTGTGAGRLILHADNSYYQGTVNVGTGSLLLGNQNASLGGIITVDSGATFGGAGTLITHLQNDSVFANRTSLNLANNATLTLGTETATAAETLYVMGSVTAGNNVVFNHDLFASGSASKLSVTGNISLAGPATINLGLLATGTFTIMEWSGAGITGANLASLSLTIAGLANNPRSSPSLAISGTTLVVTNTIFNNLVMKWTGAEGAEWTRRTTGAQLNWTDGGGSGESRFYNADSVVFDGVADAASAASRVITIAEGGVTVSGMEVTGGERYEFHGNGGIEADAGAISSATFTPAGKLEKSGAGELVFANTGANNFLGGIEISGGMITFDRASQLGAGAAGIVFSDSGTLRATAAASGALAEKLTVAAGKTAVLAVDAGGTLIYDGLLASGGAGATLAKTGAGAALLTGNNAASALALAVNEGALLLAETASLGGAITVDSGAVLGGAGAAGSGGGVALAAGGILEVGMDSAQSGTLTIHNLAMTGGAVLRLDLFADADTGGYRKSDRIYDLGTSTISGANTIDLTSFSSGTFNLGNLTGLATNAIITLSGVALPDSGRLSAALASTGGALELVTTSDQSRVMTWTGIGGSAWNFTGSSWTDGGAVRQFSYGDRVIFDGSASAASRDIDITAAEMRIADMTVSGNADHTFTGGNIHASPGNVQENGIADATGKLIKTGAGTLTFANAKNTFLGGVEIDAGALVIGSGDHLATTATTGITFTGDATLRASADLTLNDDILITAGRTAAFDTAGHDMTLAGTLAGATDATLEKISPGAMTLESGMGGFSGTLVVRAGVLRAGAADAFTAAAGASFVVDAGATLDLDSHDQTLTHLQGPGTVELGAARLTMDTGAAGADFAGGFTGAGTIVKEGAGKWTLSGSSSHTGGFILQAGEIGLTNNIALGSGPLVNASQSGLISIDANDLHIANNIAAGTGTLTLATNGRAVEFSGGMAGGTIVLDGTGTVALSGANSYTRLEIHTPLVIARRAESAAGTVVIADGSTFEFRGAESGQIAATLTGDRVLFTSSTLRLAAVNTLKKIEIGAGSHVIAGVAGALGGAGTDITVRGALETAVQGTQAHNVTVDGGALVFNSTPRGSGYQIAGLTLSGSLSFLNGGEIRLGGRLHTGIHDAAIASGGITGTPAYDAIQNNSMFMTADIIDGNLLRITAYDMALEPSKDIAATFDAMRASLDAVYSHLSDELLAPLSWNGKPGARKSIWARIVGTFATHETNREYLGYTDNTFAVMLGYDWLSTKNLMLGACLGYINTDLRTANDATTGIGLPVLGLYGARRWGDYYATANLAYGAGGADTVRREPVGERVTGSYDLDSFAASVEAGRVFSFKSGQIRPSAGIQYTGLSFRNYAETGAGAVRLDNIRIHSLQAVLRLDGSREITLPWGLPSMVDLGLGLRQSLGSKQTNFHATLVEYPDARLPIRGDKYNTSTVLARLGLRAMLTKTTVFALSYEYNYIPFGDHSNATRRDTFMATVRQSW